MTIRTLMAGAAAIALTAGMAFAQPKPKSQKEVDALMAIQNAPDPAARLAAVENLLSKFADTDFKAFALMAAAASAQQMNDFEKMVIYAERTLEADPKNFQSMLMLATGIAQRTREHDLDREDKLKRAEKYANEAIALAKTAPNPNPQGVTAEQWESVKKDSVSQAYEALGQAAFVRKNYEAAVQNWKTAVDTAGSPDAGTMVRLALVYNQLKKPDEAIAVLDKLNTMPEVHPQIKAAATEQRNAAVKLKGSAGGATAAPAGGATAAPAAAPTATPSAAPTPAPAK